MSFRPRTKTYKPTEVKGVYECELCDSRGKSYGIKFKARIMIKGQKYESKYYDTLKEAMLWYDKKRIEFGLEPIHILVKKLV